MHRKPAFLLVFELSILCALLTACGQPQTSRVQIDPTRPEFTDSPLPTVTMAPTDTLTPVPTETDVPTATPTPAPAVLIGAGDISICGQDGDDQTAALLAKNPGEIFTAGDNTNEDGSSREYKCFDKSWGKFKDRIHPAAGNHDYHYPGAQKYFEYFGAAAGKPGEGWYSYDLNGWHIVVLNSNCNDVSCYKNSPQLDWLQADLAANPAKCTLAVWHHPRWSSGLAGSDGRMAPAFKELYQAGAEIVISGHAHDYERFTPLDPKGKPDPARGIRQFVVGTGGVNYVPFNPILPESEAHNTGAFGVLKLTLYPDHYDWQFIPVKGETYTDSGSAACH